MGHRPSAARARPLDDDWISMEDDSEPNSMTTAFRWMVEWAGDSHGIISMTDSTEPNSRTTGFRWIVK